jgi:CRISPR-associated endoribonuclease Cas6
VSAKCQIPVATLAQAFRVGVFRFILKPQETLFVPALNKPNMLRGAFGTAFRQLCCIPQCRDARHCPLETVCPYKQVFEPSPPPDSERLSKNQDVPRPFIFRTAESTKTKFLPSEGFEFELVLIGRALDFLPYFVLSFRELSAKGLGLNRAKCELLRVEETDGLGSRPDSENVDWISPCASVSPPVKIYDSADQVFHTPKGLDFERRLANRVQALSGSGKIRVQFLTPTLLKAENSVKRSPEFHHLLKRLRDRINALSTFFGSGSLQCDFAELGRRAEQVRTVSSDVQWVERFRTSSKTRQRHELSGFIGSALYEGELEEFLPWLITGELIGIGKHCAFGCGRIDVRPISGT